MFLLRFIIVFFLITITVNLAAAQQKSLCMIQDSCGKCLSADESCSWCLDRDYSDRNPRCLTTKELKQAQCQQIYENKPIAELNILENRSLQDFLDDDMAFHAIQIRPQRAQITLRKFQTKQIKMTYRPAKNYPLDLYYLMDLTWSMKDDKQTLVSVGKDLVPTLQNLTKNYRIGFGSFVDKPAMPFIRKGKAEDNPCAVEHGHCEKTYGFKHRLSLNNDVTKFIQQVNETGISGNLDNLEGGLDALMQVIVCDDEIGWHRESRKIVIFASDGLMHFAGDGILAGVVKKNDKICYLDKQGDYLASLHMDYPSLEEIYRELIKRKVNVIFAVTQDVQQLYKQIQQLTQDISSVGILKMDSSNILQLVNSGYTDFVRKVQFTDNAPTHLRITYETKCGDMFDDRKETSKCSNIEIGKEYEFWVNVTLLDYPKTWNSSFVKIEEGSIRSESFEIQIDYEEECPCLKESTVDLNSTVCYEHGDFICGMCQCHSGWSGKSCDCDLSTYSSSKELEHECRVPSLAADNVTTELGAICADHGECICGQCECNYGFSGKYCSCQSCPYYQYKECGGEDRAYCDCGKCVCKPGWSGERCDCSTSHATCIAPNDDTVCSGHGSCECGQCKCGEKYYGAFCETSSSMPSALCSYYEPCVRCLLEQKVGIECSNLAELCQDKQNVSFAFEYQNDLSDQPITCMVRIVDTEDNTCDQHFAYEVNEEQQSNLRIAFRKCSTIKVGTVGAFIVIATFLIGCIFLVVLRVFTYIIDKREYAKFEEELKNRTTYQGSNPIYNSPKRYYEVPKILQQNDSEYATMTSQM